MSIENSKTTSNDIDWTVLLDHFNASNTVPDHHGEVVHSCLIDQSVPHHKNGDANPSATFNIHKGTYYCRSFGEGGDVVWLVSHILQCSRKKAGEWLSDFIMGNDLDTGDLKQRIVDILNREDDEVGPLPSYHMGCLRNWEGAHQYFTDERFISEQVQRVMHTGYDSYTHQVVIPHIWKGTLVGWQKRKTQLSAPDTPKYIWSPDADSVKKRTLYNYDNVDVTAPVVVVESPMSVLRMKSEGHDQVVATFGAGLPRTQLDLLLQFPQVVLFMDGDLAGWRATCRATDYLQSRMDVQAIPVVGPTDGADLNSEQLHDALSQAIPSFMLRPHLDVLIAHEKERMRSFRDV